MMKWITVSVMLAMGQACTGQHEAEPYEFLMRASSDPGRALANVSFSYNDQLIGRTKADGTLRVSISGQEGDVHALSVSCPQGFRATGAPLEVTLRRSGDRGSRPEYGVVCNPNSRAVVVAVRADGGRHLPVVYLGREVARTDESGAAHVLIDVAPDDQFELTLDTSGSGAERLRPQNPAMKFTVHNQDEIFTFDQRFIAEPVARRAEVQSSRPTALHAKLR